MDRKYYYDAEVDCDIMVEEITRKEALEYVTEWVNGIDSAVYDMDMNIYVEYKDGSVYERTDTSETGTFKKRNIKGIILDDGYEYYIYGVYEMDENTIPRLV